MLTWAACHTPIAGLGRAAAFKAIGAVVVDESRRTLAGGEPDHRPRRHVRCVTYKQRRRAFEIWVNRKTKKVCGSVWNGSKLEIKVR